MLNNFIYAQTKDLFLEKLNAGEVLDEAIVFIEDTKEIWNHGHYFDCSTVDLSDIETTIANMQTDISKISTEKLDKSVAESTYATKEEAEEIKWTDLNVPDQTVIMTIDDNNQNPKMPVIGDSSWIGGKRCLVKNIEDGVAICYLDENDSSKFHDGTDAALDGSMGEFMVDLAENYVTAVDYSDTLTGVKVSPTEGTTKFRRVLLGVVHGTIDENNVMHSIVDGKTQLEKTNILTFHQSANNKGIGWDIMDYEARNKVTILAYAKHGNRDLRAVYGMGEKDQSCVEGNTISLGNKENTDPVGGAYSTLGIENFLIQKVFIGGIHKEIYEVNGEKRARFYIYDGLTIDTIPSVNYRVIENVPFEYGTIGKMLWGEHADLFPINKGTAYAGVVSLHNYNSNRYMNFSGTTDSENYDFFCGIESHGQGRCGARLQYRGNITVINNPEEFKAL